MSDGTDPSRDLARRLPGLIEAALNRYLDFTGNQTPTEAKDFAAYSTACRASAAHLELLVKLSRLTGGEEPVPPPGMLSEGADLDRLIANAEAALAKAANDT